VNKKVLFKNITGTLLALLVLSLLLEYAGWTIFTKLDTHIIFPGFTSAEVLKSALVNSLGALLIGLISFGIGCLFPKVRRNCKKYLFPSLWIGIGVFYLYMFTLVIIGHVAV